MSVKRPFVLVVLDSLDSMRPPGFDIMMLVIAALGAVMATIQPASQSYILARLVLEPTLFTVALYLGLRGASGLASLVRQQIIEVYMSYPISRLGVIISIILSRVVIPAVMLLALPILISGILLYPVVLKDPVAYLLVFSGYLTQALLYGIVFLLIAIISRSSGTASVLSITFYFAYNIIWLLIQSLSSSLGSWAQHMAIAMKFYRVTYFMALQHAGLQTTGLTLTEYLFVPSIIVIATVSLVLYFTRRFEPT
ncbi:MAG: ABC transporter permease [Desulfurococcales archaeon]|nr:ABC transporter permease [Desulfurococcales archaeon]